MFLNKTIFKKWIKEAYNHNCLRVGMIHDGMALSGPHWIVWLEEGGIPNWVKASVMEFAGKLPERGELFLAGKEDGIKTRIPEGPFLDLPSRFMEAKTPFWTTRAVYGTKWSAYRLLQNAATKEIVTLSEELYRVIDLSNMENGESAPAGPSARNEAAEIMMWKNEKCALALLTAKAGDRAGIVLDLLAKVDFEEVEK